MAEWKGAVEIAAIAATALLLLFAWQEGLLNPLADRLSGSEGPWPRIEPVVNITPPEVPENLSYLEQKVFDGVNAERVKAGLAPTKWSSDLAYVARLYSQDMASRGFFGHQSPEGKYHDDRLHENGIYYYNTSAENLAEISHVSFYTYIEQTGKIINKTYKSLDEVVEAAVEGWMNSTGHRENILYPGFDESGMGAAYSGQNESFYFTQIFITRVHCGYRGASCCHTEGYLPWCYQPLNCTGQMCS